MPMSKQIADKGILLAIATLKEDKIRTTIPKNSNIHPDNKRIRVKAWFVRRMDCFPARLFFAHLFKFSGEIMNSEKLLLFDRAVISLSGIYILGIPLTTKYSFLQSLQVRFPLVTSAWSLASIRISSFPLHKGQRSNSNVLSFMFSALPLKHQWFPVVAILYGGWTVFNSGLW